MRADYFRVRTSGAAGAIGITRRDFLKIGGTGLAGAALLGTAGCGAFSREVAAKGVLVPPRSTSTF